MMERIWKKVWPVFLILFVTATGCKKDTSDLEIDPSKPAIVKSLALKINGAACALVDSTYYYPVSLGASLNNYTLSFDSTLTSVQIGDVKVANGAAVNYALKTNQEVQIQATDKENRTLNYKLLITGLPIVQLSTRQDIGDDEIGADFTLINPDFAAQKSQLQIASKINIKIRGASSRAYPKKSYAVKLVDNSGEDIDQSLMGLRDDNSWILDAMYIDQSRMRNRLSTDIWNSFNNVPYIDSEPKALNGTRGYMVEVFLNNEYAGVYCLTEKLDRKQLKIKKEYGVMYKANERGLEVDLKGVAPYNNNSDTWGGWELEYPELGDTPAPDWKYLYDFVGFVSKTSQQDFVSEAPDKVDINNMVDYYIFMNILSAQDNQSKNTFLSFYDNRKNNKFFYSVWDLDATLGRLWKGEKSDNFIIGAGDNNLLDRLVSWNVGGTRELIKQRWSNLKYNQLSKNAFDKRVEAYRNQLVSTNAFAREKATWNNFEQDLNTETSYMKSWYSAQYDKLDAYINNL
ncbi:CotH kinase family protein [Mucilaginibacter sp. Bleaf8]|uniref:CotH kinase family protein n=1 Tax=Mucilaginibacter sp. Bleaf8 TaxID=2834430 RepID=UPI001BD05F26|nr:CotH kinase family protein [Mucilaginibacter sp. Bleaf8]MBS7566290.1 CotH kinase family protein [Mucilaginibacter sp. Bleaf8]